MVKWDPNVNCSHPDCSHQANAGMINQWPVCTRHVNWAMKQATSPMRHMRRMFHTIFGEEKPPMRTIETHKGSAANDLIVIEAVDEPGPGGASHIYAVDLNRHSKDFVRYAIRFQKGAVEGAVNGMTEESLLAILIDRLVSFQNGPYPCAENEHAIDCLEEALSDLQRRTRDRRARGVEGRYEM